MIKLIKLFVFVVVISFIFKARVFAVDREIVSSGKLIAIASLPVDERPIKLKAYLISKGSPCASYAYDFIRSADKYGLDWKLGPAISGIESSFCQVYPHEYNNPFGISGGFMYFEDMPASIDYLNKLISTESYYRDYQQSGNLYDLAAVYCERSEHWVYAVSKFMAEMDNFSYIAPQSLTITL